MGHDRSPCLSDREDGAVVHTERDDRGVSALPRGGSPTVVAAIRAQLGDLPMLLAEMVGSTLSKTPAGKSAAWASRHACVMVDRVGFEPT